MRLGGGLRSVKRLRARGLGARKGLQEDPRVRVLRIVDHARQRPSSASRPAYIRRDMVGRLRDHAEVVGDEDDGGAVLGLELAARSRICAWTVTSSASRRLVGGQDLGAEDECHGDHHALAHPARELIGIAREPVHGVRDPRPLGAPRVHGRAPLLRRARAPGPPRRSAGRLVERWSDESGTWKSSRRACRARGEAGRTASREGRRRRAAPRRR